jgi:hypothetical protein
MNVYSIVTTTSRCCSTSGRPARLSTVKATEERGTGVTGAAAAEQVDEFRRVLRPDAATDVFGARSLSGDDPRVEDVVQEALLIARHRWDRVGHYDRQYAWAIKVELRMLNHLRTSYRSLVSGHRFDGTAPTGTIPKEWSSGLVDRAGDDGERRRPHIPSTPTCTSR